MEENDSTIIQKPRLVENKNQYLRKQEYAQKWGSTRKELHTLHNLRALLSGSKLTTYTSKGSLASVAPMNSQYTCAVGAMRSIGSTDTLASALINCARRSLAIHRQPPERSLRVRPMCFG